MQEERWDEKNVNLLFTFGWSCQSRNLKGRYKNQALCWQKMTTSLGRQKISSVK